MPPGKRASVFEMLLRPVFVGAAVTTLVAGCGGEYQPADTARRTELEPLYDYLFEQAAGQLDHDLRTGADEWDALGRDRVINAANNLADKAAATPQRVYVIDLPYLWVEQKGPIVEQGPRDFRLEITHEQLVELGVLERGTAAGRSLTAGRV